MSVFNDQLLSLSAADVLRSRFTIYYNNNNNNNNIPGRTYPCRRVQSKANVSERLFVIISLLSSSADVLRARVQARTNALSKLKTTSNIDFSW